MTDTSASDEDDEVRELPMSNALTGLHYAEQSLVFMRHLGALRQITDLLEAGNVPAAVARIEGAVAELERVVQHQIIDRGITAEEYERITRRPRHERFDSPAD